MRSYEELEINIRVFFEAHQENADDVQLSYIFMKLAHEQFQQVLAES
jgi:anthranilate phosphoribosyltransferase